MRSIFKHSLLFLVGGSLYLLIEVAFRGHTHWTMLVVGGVSFVLCGLVNEIFSWEMLIELQMLICMLIITAVEFVSGCILNLWIGLNVWDYSNLPLNLIGQICLPFSAAWYFLSLVAIVLDDYLRYWLFHEEKPRYVWR